MNKTIELPEHAEKAHRVVVGISRNENKQRVVYVYWHHSKLPGRTDWVHNETDGSPADWTHCEHCEGTGIYEETSVTDKQEERTVRGLCYQCFGKGRQSAADRKRNRKFHPA